MDDTISLLKMQGIKPESQGARLPVIELAPCINGDENIVIEVLRVGVRRCAIGVERRISDLPGPRAKEMFPWDLRERLTSASD